MTSDATTGPTPASHLDRGELASRLRLAVTRLARQLRQQSDIGLTPSQLSALAVVDRHGPMTPGRLAELERVAPPTITRVIAKLEQLALVERSADPTDRRSTRVAVTKGGAALLSRARTRKQAWLAARIGALDDANQADLSRALDALEALVELEADHP